MPGPPLGHGIALKGYHPSCITERKRPSFQTSHLWWHWGSLCSKKGSYFKLRVNLFVQGIFLKIPQLEPLRQLYFYKKHYSTSLDAFAALSEKFHVKKCRYGTIWFFSQLINTSKVKVNHPRVYLELTHQFAVADLPLDLMMALIREWFFTD